MYVEIEIKMVELNGPATDSLSDNVGQMRGRHPLTIEMDGLFLFFLG